MTNQNSNKMNDYPSQIYPFGFNDSEKELDKLPQIYLYDLEFNRKALDPHVSIIIGRRGSGKTALAHFFNFKNGNSYDIYVDIDEPTTFTNILEQLSKDILSNNQINVVENIAKMWELSFWTSLMGEVVNDKRFENVEAINDYLHHVGIKNDRGSQIVRVIFQTLAGLVSESAGKVVELIFKVHEILNSKEFIAAKDALFKLMDNGYKAVIVIDTLELYQIRKYEMQQALGAMLHTVTKFSFGAVHKNLHIKCFLPGEIMPFLLDTAVQNIGKTFQAPVHLNWRPKELLRLSSKRLYSYLEEKCKEFDPNCLKNIKIETWGDYSEVKAKVWNKFFPEKIINKAGVEEDTFQYIMRHSQLRPRQIIWICNSIANEAYADKKFPYIEPKHIVNGINKIEETLALEVINSFSKIYPNARNILACFRGVSNYLERSSTLDKLAARTKNAWNYEDLEYDRYLFQQMVCEMGIVGSIHQKTGKYLEAEFEYILPDRLVMNYDEEIVIHPMFYNYFRVKAMNDQFVYPVGPGFLENRYSF